MSSVHRSVLLQEVLQHLHIHEGDIVVDATLGGGGHAKEMAKAAGQSGTLIGFDADSAAIARAQVALCDAPGTVVLVQSNFRNIDTVLAQKNITGVNAALFDLGYSSDQLESGRGFTFLKDEPLSMSLSDTDAPYTAADIVNTWSEQSIADIVYGWGEERYAKRIAHEIVRTRSQEPITTTFQLVAAIERAVPTAYTRGKIHCATKTFQALRIAVNDEIQAIAQALERIRPYMAQGGSIAVISFHSIEDRVVKNIFRTWEKENVAERVTKKPVVPTPEELVANPRARSAKLRVCSIS